MLTPPLDGLPLMTLFRSVALVVVVDQAEGSHGSLIRHRQRVLARNQERAAAAATGGGRGGAGAGTGVAVGRGQNAAPHRWNFLSRAVRLFFFFFFFSGFGWEIVAPAGHHR